MNEKRFLLFLFLWLPWLGLPKLYWIIVVRVGTFVLFLISEEVLSVFLLWEWWWLWVCFIWPLLCWSRFSEDPPEEARATYSSILTWSVPTNKGAWWAMIHRVAESRSNWSELAWHSFSLCPLSGESLS